MESCGTAKVEKAWSGRARVVIDRQKACASCQSADLCHALSGRGTLHLEVDNPIGAREGQLVELQASRSGGLKAATMVYLLPALFLLAGILVGTEVLRWNPLPSGLLGFVALGVSWFLAWLYDRRARTSREFRVIITRVLQS